MQRLFSTFADGYPGGGIFLLRVLTGFGLIHRGIAVMTGAPSAAPLLLYLIGAGAGLLILGGLWTPVVGLLAGVLEIWMAFILPGTAGSAISLAVLSVSLAMIGPGAWSIDARLYGRKQILPPDP
ncbi:MAG: hypothetical protein ABI759_07870 [Candidatus Solibacter sp.]